MWWCKGLNLFLPCLVNHPALSVFPASLDCPALPALSPAVAIVTNNNKNILHCSSTDYSNSIVLKGREPLVRSIHTPEY